MIALPIARRLLPIALGAMLPFWCGTAQAAPAVSTEVAATCWPDLPAEWQGVLLVSEGNRTEARADGVEGGRPLTLATRFNIASLGKMLTAVAIGQLVDEGRLSFADPIGKHLPELPEAFHALTVAQLLSHTAGLGDYISDSSPAAITQARSALDLLPLAIATSPENVGTWSYSNSGYAVAGAIVERVSGQTLQSFLEARVFGPAGMTGVGFAPAPADALPTRIGEDGKPFHPRGGQLPAGPAGGHFASAEDLARFGEALLRGRLLRPETLATMSSIFVENQPPRGDGIARGWGLGFGVTGIGPTRVFGHVGGIPGAGAAMRFVPASGRIIIALANQDIEPAAPLSSKLLPMDLSRCAAAMAGRP
jgi:D-alanyl-D-alanine carboxypeptidase